jgi:hypothetical protein
VELRGPEATYLWDRSLGVVVTHTDRIQSAHMQTLDLDRQAARVFDNILNSPVVYPANKLQKG